MALSDRLALLARAAGMEVCARAARSLLYGLWQEGLAGTVSYEQRRERFASLHDDYAIEALRDALSHDNLPVKCMSYCYGGSANPQIQEILADLAESGWRLVKP